MFDPNTTWLGLWGGGVSGSILAGGSVYQIDLWHMGGNPIPVRALVTGTRLGLVAEASVGHAALLVTGCSNGQDMDNITSSGVDWELPGKSLVKSGKLFKDLAALAASESINWATTETAKRFAQWVTGDLGIVQPGRQFNLIPSPIAIGTGVGLFYDWQTLNLLSGNIGWQHMSPRWCISNIQGGVWFQMMNIPEQDGEMIHLGFSVPEWGIDPYIRWKQDRGASRPGRSKDYHVNAYVYHGHLFERSDGMGVAGINLSNYLPVGRLEESIFTGFDRSSTVEQGGNLTARPEVFNFSNLPYWTADQTFTVSTDGDGRFASVQGGGEWKD